MSLNAIRVRAICRKELREYRRKRSIVVAMSVIPLLFVVNPLVAIFALPASASGELRHGDVLLYMLGIPAIVPAVITAYSIAGERQQGTLEPVLTTPIRRDEFLLGKALAALVPSVAIAYTIYVCVLACIEAFAHPTVASALLRGPDIIAQLLLTPLVAGWSIWVGMAISTLASDIRVAQQLGMLASLPTIAVTTLIAYGMIRVTLGVALGVAAALVILNGLGWRMVSAAFDRERLVAGARS